VDTQSDSLFPDLTVYRFLLALQLGPGRESLPLYLGSTFRGVFASSFRRIVCVTGAPECHGCLLIHRCAYPYIFETPPPPDSPEVLQKRFRQAPRPYVLQVPGTYDAGTELELGLVVIGKAIDFLPYFIYVLQEMGKQGLGRTRVPYRLLTVRDGSTENGPVVFQADRQVLSESFRPIRLAALKREGDKQVTDLTLEFLTPLRIKKYGGYGQAEEQLDFSQLVDLLLGRIEALAFFHCGEPWGHDEQVREEARKVQVVSRNLSFYSLERYSNRQQQKLPLHGYVGTITVEGPLGTFLPLLRLGEYLHLGAGTAFGLGQYRLHVSGRE